MIIYISTLFIQFMYAHVYILDLNPMKTFIVEIVSDNIESISCFSYSHTVWCCSSGDSCSEWTHQDSPETVGGRSQCQLSEQGDDCECAVAMYVVKEYSFWKTCGPLCVKKLHIVSLTIPSQKEPFRYIQEKRNFYILNIIICDKFVNGNDTEGSDCTLHCLTKWSCDNSKTTAGEGS